MDVTNIITMDTLITIINNAQIIGIVLIVLIILPILVSMYLYGFYKTKGYIHKNIFDEEMIINIIMNVGLIAGFLGVFFFTYAAGVEADIVKNNVKVITDDLMELISPALNPIQKQQLRNELQLPDMTHEDEKVSQSNATLTADAYSQLIIIVDIALTIAFILSVIYKHPFMKILGFNLIVLGFVGLTEFTFINFLPRKYISADTNYTRYTILKDLKGKFVYAPSITDNGTLTPSITDIINKINKL